VIYDILFKAMAETLITIAADRGSRSRSPPTRAPAVMSA
jgi:hypothetical protein